MSCARARRSPLWSPCPSPQVNSVVHDFAMRHLTPNYINSYWATEHGGIVWSRCHGNDDQPLQPDARSWPLPWIDAAVLVADGEGWREAAAGEKGEVVIRRPYPYMALTVRRPRCDRAREGMRRANGVAEP